MEKSEKQKFTPIIHKTDRDIVQSYIFTFARYGNLSACEKRILYNMIYDKQIQDNVRENIENKKFNSDDKTNNQKFVGFIMPLSKVTQNVGSYADVKKAFVSLAKKGFEYEDENTWKYLNFIILPKITKWNGCAYFQVPLEVYNVITQIRRGYRQFNLDVVLSLKSVYAMRFYEMFSRQDNAEMQPLKRKIEELKKQFCLENKYTENSMFVRRVIEPAKQELDEKANYSFDYQLQKSLGSRKYDIIVFTVKHIPENEIKNNELLENRAKAIISKEIRLSDNIYQGLLDMGFLEGEILKNKYTLFIAESMYQKRFGTKIQGNEKLLSDLDTYKTRALKADRDNWKAYVIGTLRKVQKIENDKERASIILAHQRENEDIIQNN